MTIFSRILVGVGILLLVLLVALVSMALVLGFALGIGWVITWLVPSFSLFQASLLALLTSVIVGTFWYNFLGAIPGFGSTPTGDDEGEFDDEDDYNRIPSSRFFKNDVERTWETWLRYHLANSVYMEFQDSPQPVAPMGDKQQQELAIRLADLSIALLKSKSPRGRRVNVNMTDLKRQMDKMGQRHYDDNILQLALMALNDELVYHTDEILDVIRLKLWNAPFEGIEE
jgi:hypothetical protein